MWINYTYLKSDLFWTRISAFVLSFSCNFCRHEPHGKGVTDTHLILGNVDGAILVVKAEKTSKLLVRDSVKIINELGENLVGVVFNGADTFRNKFY